MCVENIGGRGVNFLRLIYFFRIELWGGLILCDIDCEGSGGGRGGLPRVQRIEH